MKLKLPAKRHLYTLFLVLLDVILITQILGLFPQEAMVLFGVVLGLQLAHVITLIVFEYNKKNLADVAPDISRLKDRLDQELSEEEWQILEELVRKHKTHV